MIRFIDPVYRHPTHGRFYYILFYPHIIISIKTKKKIISGANHTPMTVTVCPIARGSHMLVRRLVVRC